MFPQFDDDKGEGKQRDQLPVPAPLVLDSQWILNFKFAFKFGYRPGWWEDQEGRGQWQHQLHKQCGQTWKSAEKSFEWTVITLKDILTDIWGSYTSAVFQNFSKLTVRTGWRSSSQGPKWRCFGDFAKRAFLFRLSNLRGKGQHLDLRAWD